MRAQAEGQAQEFRETMQRLEDKARAERERKKAYHMYEVHDFERKERMHP